MQVRQHDKGEQQKLWNGSSGSAWIELQEVLDELFKPFELLLVEAVSIESVRRVLDVGCGTGGTTVAIARQLGANGHCVGIDISEPLIAAARCRAEREGIAAQFIRADAQTYELERASFDAFVSRFGVMFFDDPVKAFANLRRAARDDAALTFIAWRSAAENPFMTTAERAAAPLLPNLPPRDPDAPGQFAFAAERKVRAILERAGWVHIDIRPVDVDCIAPEKVLVRYFTTMGPLGRVLPEADDTTRARVITTVRAAFDPYVHGAEVRFTAACWAVSARAGRSTTAR